VRDSVRRMSITRRELFLAAAAGALEAACSGALAKGARCADRPVTGDIPASHVDGQPRELWSYNEMQRATAKVYRPRDQAALVRRLQSLRPGQRVTFRGGGQSLDAQSLNRDIVIVLDAPNFSYIGDPQHDADGYFITTGAGARWWDVICKIGKLGLFPPSMATAADATVGGTLSADCVSRMSAIWGKEGEQIRSFKMVFVDGTTKECRRNDADLELRELFEAVIGGFGYLGAVIEVTFDLIAVRSKPNAPGDFPRVFTRSTRHPAIVDWDQILRALHSKAADELRRAGSAPGGRPRPSAPPFWSALSIACYLAGQGMTANLLEQRFVEPTAQGKPTPGDIYKREPEITVTAAAWSAVAPTVIELASDIGFPSGEFVDDLFGWAFFFGNWATRAKLRAHESGDRLNFTQHTFALPALVDGKPDTRPARRFLERVESRLHRADVRPPSIDLLYVPGDRFLMSASRNLDAYLINISLAAKDRDDYRAEVKNMLYGLARDCRMLGGRVHLVKSVVAEPEELRAMYGEAASKLKQLKHKYDPNNLLRNDFFDRVFDA
jgi:decaprenylphospho-beta-D-ribofuranose 2-oxidase